MNVTDPELSDWAMSLENDFLLECPKCNYKFPDTLRLTDRIKVGNTGIVFCRRCGQKIRWKEKRTYVCSIVEPQ